MTEAIRGSHAPPPAGTGGEPQVAIVGGGASGVLMALHLLTRPGGTCQVTIIEGRNLLGCGIAYSTDDPDHLLNTRVRNMSAFPDDSDHFRRWLGRRPAEANASGEDFVSRAIYGAYLGSLLQPWLTGPGSRRLRCLRRSCVAVTRAGGRQVLHLDGGACLLADRVILATGHALPAPQPLLHGAWAPVGAIDPEAAVLVVGTGLSMVDQVLSLIGRGHRGPITAVSRRGLLPRGHAPTGTASLSVADLPLGAPVSAWLRWLRLQADAAAAAGGTWRDAVDALRPHLRHVWQGLPEAERRRFLRHAVAWWDIHRHRIPPASARRIDEAMARGQLRLLRGRFETVARDPQGRLAVTLRQPRTAAAMSLMADLVIDCRGIRHDPLRTASPLIRDLVAHGRARIDPLGIGLDVAPDCAVISARGQPDEALFAIGPASRAAFWEITAIPDIREQTFALAGQLTAALAPTGA